MTTQKEEASDISLINAYKEGNLEVADELVSRYKDYIFRLSYRFMRNYEDAMDLTQEVLIRVFKGLDKYKERNYFKGWLYRIVVNTGINMRAKASNRELPTDKIPDLTEDSRDSVEKSFENTYMKEVIESASDKLKGKQRDVFILRYYEDMSHEEIAKILKISPDSAKSNYYYALKKMKTYLQDMGVTL